MAAGDGFESKYVGGQRGGVLETGEGVEHLGYAVVCEHGDLVDIVESAVGFTLETGPEVGGQYLGAFVEAYRCIFESVHVVEAGEVVDEEINEGGCGGFGLGDAGCEATIKAFLEYVARLSHAVYSVVKEGHLFGGTGSEDVLEDCVRAFCFVDPEGGVGYRYALVKRSLYGSYQAPVPCPLLATIFDCKFFFRICSFGPETEIKQVHQENEVNSAFIFGFGMKFVFGPISSAVIFLSYQCPDRGSGCFGTPHINSHVCRVVVYKFCIFQYSCLRRLWSTLIVYTERSCEKS